MKTIVAFLLTALLAGVCAASGRCGAEAAGGARGMVWPDAGWTDAACAAAHVDIVPFHAYPETVRWTPESVTVETYLHDYGSADFLPVERSACGRARVSINETGFATVGGKTEQDQAMWWARAIPTFLSAPAVEEIGVYLVEVLPR